MVRGKGLFAAQHVANLGDRQFRMLFEQVNDAQAHRVSYRFEDSRDAFQFFRLFVLSSGAIFVGGLLDCPHYTRPEVYQGEAVPGILMSGDHKKIRRWRLKQSLARTRKRRPDLLAHRVLSAEETQLLTEISGEEQCGE